MQVAWTVTLEANDGAPAALLPAADGGVVALGTYQSVSASADAAQDLPSPIPFRAEYSAEGALTGFSPLVVQGVNAFEEVSVAAALMGPEGGELLVHRLATIGEASNVVAERCIVVWNGSASFPPWSLTVDGTALVEPRSVAMASPTSVLFSAMVSADAKVRIGGTDVSGSGSLVLAWVSLAGQVLATSRLGSSLGWIDSRVSPWGTADAAVVAAFRDASTLTMRAGLLRVDAGTVLAERLIAADQDVGLGCVLVADDRVHVAVSTAGHLDFEDVSDSAQPETLVLMAFDDELSLLWLTRLAIDGEAAVTVMAADDAGHLLVAGSFRGVLQVGNLVLASAVSSGFLLRLDSSGNGVDASAMPGPLGAAINTPIALVTDSTSATCATNAFVLGGDGRCHPALALTRVEV